MHRGIIRSSSYGDTSLSRKRGFSATALSPERSLSLSDVSVARASGKRRVNPESLAVRLGPELVKELEALLKPGMSEMPPFSVRQEIQQRYDINRRHIYDWFHSKGLRVTKEEKRAVFEAHRAVARADRVIQKCPGPHTSAPGLSRSPSVLYGDSSDGTFNLHSTPPNHGAMFTTGDPFVPTPPAYYPNRYFGPPVYALPLDGSGLQTSPIYLSPLFPVDDTYLQSKTPVDTSTPFQTQRLWDQLSELEALQAAYNISSTAPASIGSTHGEQLASLLPLHGDDYLPQPERTAYYDCLSGVLGPATGIQECVGSYKAFMTDQTQKYYERLLPSTTNSSRSSNNVSTAAYSTVATGQPSAHTRGSIPEVITMSRRDLIRSGQSVNSASPLDCTSANKENDADFNKWLLYGGRSHSSSPACTPDLSSDSGTDTPGFWGSNSLDDSICGLDIADILESPVLRSRNSSYVQDRAANYPEVHLDVPVGALGCDAFDPQLIPADFSALQTIFCDNEHALHSYLQNSALFPVASTQSSDISLTLQHAMTSPGLENTAKTKVKERTVRGRVGLGRTRTNSAGGGM